MVLSVIGIAKCLFNHFRGTKPAQLGMLLSFFTLQGLVSNADGGQYEPRGPDIQSQAVGQAMQAERLCAQGCATGQSIRAETDSMTGVTQPARQCEPSPLFAQ